MSKERGSFQIGKDTRNGATEFGDFGNTFTRTQEFDLRKGELPLKLPEGVSELFSAEVPFSGFEDFYLPEAGGGTGLLARDVDEIVPLSTRNTLAPHLSGAWTYHWSKSDTGTRVAGPYYLESADARYFLSGYLERQVSLQPLRFSRISASINCRVRPATALYSGKQAAKIGDIPLAQFDEAVVHVAMRMVPLDSDEGKKIKIPESILPDAPHGK